MSSETLTRPRLNERLEPDLPPGCRDSFGNKQPVLSCCHLAPKESSGTRSEMLAKQGYECGERLLEGECFSTLPRAAGGLTCAMTLHSGPFRDIPEHSESFWSTASSTSRRIL